MINPLVIAGCLKHRVKLYINYDFYSWLGLFITIGNLNKLINPLVPYFWYESQIEAIIVIL